MDNRKDAFDIRIENAFDFLSDEYAALFHGSVATAFQHPVWLHGIYSKLVPAVGAQPLVVIARYRKSGALAMVLPLLRVRRGPIRTVEFADLRVSDYIAPICTTNVFGDLLRDENACQQIRRLVRPFDLMRIPKLPDGRIPIENLLGAPRRVAMNFNAYSTVLPDTFGEWQANALDRSYQKELAKKYRQLQKKGKLDFSCCDHSTSVADAMEVMKKLRGPRFQAQGDGDLLQRPEYFDFYADVATRGLGSLVRLYTMTMDGKVIAAVLGLCHGGSVAIIMSAFDIAGYKKQSLGALTFEQVARDCIERGDRVLDFTIGDESYKRLFGARPSPMWSVTEAGSMAGSVALLALRRAPWIKLAAKRMTGLRLLPMRISTGAR